MRSKSERASRGVTTVEVVSVLMLITLIAVPSIQWYRASISARFCTIQEKAMPTQLDMMSVDVAQKYNYVYCCIGTTRECRPRTMNGCGDSAEFLLNCGTGGGEPG